MKHSKINESNLPSKLLVKLSSKIINELDVIEEYNKDNVEGISKWHDYLDWVENYISNPVIAFDYSNKYPRLPNGAYSGAMSAR